MVSKGVLEGMIRELTAEIERVHAYKNRLSFDTMMSNAAKAREIKKSDGKIRRLSDRIREIRKLIDYIGLVPEEELKNSVAPLVATKERLDARIDELKKERRDYAIAELKKRNQYPLIVRQIGVVKFLLGQSKVLPK